MSSISRIRLQDIATADVRTVRPETSMPEVISIFAAQGISALIVADGRQPIGIVTERDLLNLLATGDVGKQTVAEVMSAPLLTARWDLDFSAAQLLMLDRGVRHLVLVDDEGHLCGVATETDFRRHLGADLLSMLGSLRVLMDRVGTLVDPGLPLVGVLQMMASGRLDYVIAGHHGRAEGLLTERDIPGLLLKQINPAQVTLGEVMTRGLVSIGIGASVVEAVHKMGQAGFRHMLVEDEHGRLAGMVSQHRLLERLGFMLHEQGERHFQRGIETVMAGAGVGCWEFDHERLELLRSAAINNMMGLGNEPSREKLDAVLARTHPDDRARLGEQFLDVLNGDAGEGMFTTDYRIILPSGEVRWVSSRGQVVEYGRSGKPRWSAGVTVDITQNKLAEQQRADSERRFRQLIEDVPLALAYVTASGEFSFLNRGFVELFGYTRDVVPNVTVWGRLAYPDPRYRGHAHDIWKAALAHARENRIPVSPIQFDVCCADGVRRMVEIGGIFFGGDFLCTFIDVTERHQQYGILEFGNAILGDVSANRPLPEVLHAIASRIEQRVPNVLVSILLLDDEGACLRHATAPSLPESYTRALDGMLLDSDPVACAVAVSERRVYFCPDLAQDGRWSAYRDIATQSGLAAALSVPILSTGERVLGVFCLYWREPGGKLEHATQRYLDAATRLAAVAIENEEQDARLRRASSRMQGQLEELRRWQQLTVGREGRVLELKREVNALLARLGEAPRYLSVADGESA